MELRGGPASIEEDDLAKRGTAEAGRTFGFGLDAALPRLTAHELDFSLRIPKVRAASVEW